MKSRLLWLAILAVGGTAAYFGITQPHVTSIPESIRNPIADLKPAGPPPLEPPALVISSLPTLAPPVLAPVLPPRNDPILGRPEVPIQHGATIDFSTGAPVVKSFGKDQDALESALKEIAEVEKAAKVEAKK